MTTAADLHKLLAQIRYDLSVTQSRLTEALRQLAALNLPDNKTPPDPEAAIRRMITNGAIPDLITLNAELTAANLNGTTADQLRALLPVTSSPDDDIPL